MREGGEKKFDKKVRWLKGPEMLLKLENEWPVLKEEVSNKETPKILTSLLVTVESPTSEEVLPAEKRFSSWLQLIRSSARVLQFINILLLIFITFKFWFGYSLFEEGDVCAKKSKLLKLTPILDEGKILRS